MDIALPVCRPAHLVLPLLFIILLVPSVLHAMLPDGRAASIDSLFTAYDSTNAPGASVVIIKDGAILYEKCYGYAELATRRKILPSTNFRLASMTKQFTAMCIMMLKEQGKLSFDDPLTAVFPDFPAYGRAITIRHLLTHTSGLIDYESLIPDSQMVQATDKDVLGLLKATDSTYFPPGSKYLYSNTGYALLALIVEKASGETFAGFLQRHIFSPLGMGGTLAYEHGISEVRERAFGYARTDSGFVFADQSVTSAVLGDGGIYSSVEDLVRWDAALSTSALIPVSLREESFADARLTDGTPIDYGYGWHKEVFCGIRHPYHSGSTRGFRNAITRFPEQRLTVIILTNRNEGDPIRIANTIAAMFLECNNAEGQEGNKK